jgi:hypothetical protein
MKMLMNLMKSEYGIYGECGRSATIGEATICRVVLS